MSAPPAFPFPRTHPPAPSAEYARLRREAPISRVTTSTGDNAWIATRYEDVRTIYSDPRFSRAAVLQPGAPRSSHLDALDPESMINSDDPRHGRLRRLVVSSFSTRRVEALRGRTAIICSDLLEEMAAAGPPADLRAHLSIPLPVTVICELLGVPARDHARFGAWSSMFFANADTDLKVVLRARDDLIDYLTELVAAKRERPAEDLISALISARDDEDRLSEDELVNLAMTVLVGGHETTANQLANSVVVLLGHPDQLAALRADPSLLPQTVEELLRYCPLTAGNGLTRIALEDVELSGTTVRAGEAVIPISGVANRDPEVFSDPERFDIDREKNPHVAFGHGIHHCLGAQLARMELQVTLTALLSRFPHLRLAIPAGDLVWKKDVITNTLDTLPVTW